LRNAAAVAIWLSGQGKPVAIIAAGERWTDDTIRFAVEDLIGAGAIISQLAGTRSPEAGSAAAAFQSCASNLASTLIHSSSGRELEQRGFAGDVALAAELDADSCVPQLIDRAFRAAR
jgi:2-phosphosulfolactate phosphatase